MSWLLPLLVAAVTPAPPAELVQEREMAAQLAGREQTLLNKLADAEREVDLEARALKAAQTRLRASSARLAAAEKKATVAESGLRAATEEAAPRLLARYKLGREGYVRFLLGASSVPDLIKRRRLYDAVLEADLAALERLRSIALARRAARDELAQIRDEQAGAVEAEAGKRAALEERAAQQRRLLASVQEDRALHEEAVREMEDAARDLGGQVGRLQKPAAPLAGAVAQALEEPMKKLRGKLLFPVEAGRIEAHFGRALDPRFGTVTLQRGIDVRCEPGLPVRAIHAGRVVHAGWFRGYGNLVIVDHGDGYFSLMAHLSTLTRARDEEVRRGDVIGTVGDSGSLKGPYLYFELRQGQRLLDPERWLRRPRKPSPGPLAEKAAAR